jgi:dTDP-4-dehydrorhamnose 3,5-epimerase-like enzyme
LKFEFHTLPVFQDDRGSLVPIELKEYINWTPKRVYYLWGNTDTRGGHAHRIENELFVCQKGSVTARLHDGRQWHEKRLDSPKDAVRVDNMIWHEFTDFSEDALLLAVTSTNYDTDDYIRDFDQFLNETSK